VALARFYGVQQRLTSKQAARRAEGTSQRINASANLRLNSQPNIGIVSCGWGTEFSLAPSDGYDTPDGVAGQ
jgi:hypothetical protein